MRKVVLLCLALIICLVPIFTAGCAGEAKSITVGNKNFTEEYVIGQLLVQLLEAEGFEVSLVSDLSTMALREGMEAGDIDICADYTGTAWMTHLGHEYTPGMDNNEVYRKVKDEEVGNGFTWLDPIWNNNTYVLVSWPEFVETNGLTTISDLAALYKSGATDITTFVGFEFSTRPDGLPALKEHYGFISGTGKNGRGADSESRSLCSYLSTPTNRIGYTTCSCMATSICAKPEDRATNNRRSGNYSKYAAVDENNT